MEVLSFSRLDLTGRVSLSLLPNNICAGLYCIPVTGVFLYQSSAIFGSVPSSAHFSSNIFRIPAYFSASPLLFGYLGLDVTTVKFHSVANCSNSADEKVHYLLSEFQEFLVLKISFSSS